MVSKIINRFVGAQCWYNDSAKAVTQSKPSLKSASLKSTPSVAADEICSADVLSNSSLRRKLFFHGDKGTPLSPVRCVMPTVACWCNMHANINTCIFYLNTHTVLTAIFLSETGLAGFYLFLALDPVGLGPNSLYPSLCAGSGVVRIDPLCFLAGCHKRWLNQA